ncbi:hypothetical protein K1719_026231 [Acacia pycnantha]|nr:hypothetical protein K1719_026231 [Acacia pycnantha]
MEKQVVENLWLGERESHIEAAMELTRLSSKQRHKLAENVNNGSSDFYPSLSRQRVLCSVLPLAVNGDGGKFCREL